jgi:DNA-binding Lrp family transcriptional regulator
MTDAYVDVVADAGAVSPAASDIAAIDAVTQVHVVTGEQDMIVQLDLEDQTDLPTVVADEIHTVTGVADTVTHVAFEA